MSISGFQPTKFPQLFIQHTEGHIECRVYNWKVYKDSAGRVSVKRNGCLSWKDAVVIALFAGILGSNTIPRTTRILTTTILFIVYSLWRCSTVLWESVIAIPPHGIQKETHKGIFGIPVFISRKFIPTFQVRDIIINEALRRWNVVYYLAVLVVGHDNEYKLEVLFENILPEFQILRTVRGVLKDRMLKSE